MECSRLNVLAAKDEFALLDGGGVGDG